MNRAVLLLGLRLQAEPRFDLPELRGLGQVFVDGALWRARRSELDGEQPIAPGDPVVVERVSGLTLTVRPAEEWEVLP
jgi:membrane-bound serine protease (ClpP class)